MEVQVSYEYETLRSKVLVLNTSNSMSLLKRSVRLRTDSLELKEFSQNYDLCDEKAKK